MRIVARCRRIRSPIALPSRLDPHKGVLESVSSISRGAHAEASADDIAPVASGLLFRRLYTITTSVGDEVRWEVLLLQEWRQRIDVFFLVAVGVALGV